MADAHWAASARMPSNLLLAEAVTAAQEAGRHGDHPDALQWVVVLQHLRHCCQAYRQVLIPLLPLSPPPPPPSSPLPLLLFFVSCRSCPSSSACSLLLQLSLSQPARSAVNLRYPGALNAPLSHETASRMEDLSSTNSLSVCLQGRTGARAFCCFSPSEQRSDQPTEQAASQQQAVGIRHSGSAAAAVRGCFVPGAVQRRYACCAWPHDQLQTQLPHAPTHG